MEKKLLVPTSLQILIQNLKLLQYSVEDANKVKQFSDFKQMHQYHLNSFQIPHKNFLSIFFNFYYRSYAKMIQGNSKLPLHLCNKTKLVNISNRYPPRTVTEQSEYRKFCIDYIRKLQKQGQIPKNFNYGKVVLDDKQGLRQIRFLRQFLGFLIITRFLSEFALRTHFLFRFTNVRLQTIFINPAQLLMGDDKFRSSFNEISDIFSTASYALDGRELEQNKIPDEILYHLIEICKDKIVLFQCKLSKILRSNAIFVEKTKEIVETMVKLNSENKEKFIEIQQRLQNLKNTVNQKYLTKERQLDRQPLIDLSIKVFKDLESIRSNYLELRLDDKLSRLSEDHEQSSALSRFDRNYIVGKNTNAKSIIHINQIYEKLNKGLENLEENVVFSEKQNWLLNLSNKVKEQSATQLNLLKQLKEKLVKEYEK